MEQGNAEGVVWLLSLQLCQLDCIMPFAWIQGCTNANLPEKLRCCCERVSHTALFASKHPLFTVTLLRNPSNLRIYLTFANMLQQKDIQDYIRLVRSLFCFSASAHVHTVILLNGWVFFLCACVCTLTTLFVRLCMFLACEQRWASAQK